MSQDALPTPAPTTIASAKLEYLPSSPSIASIPENTPTGILTPQLARHTIPFPNSDSTINYRSVVEDEDEVPPGFIPNKGKWHYPIYVRNPYYIAGENTKTIVAHYIKYSHDYTKVEGTMGVGREVKITPVYTFVKKTNYKKMMTEDWNHFRHGSKQEFTMDVALQEMGDIPLIREVNHLHGQLEVKDTLENLARDARHRLSKLTKELVIYDQTLKDNMKRLEQADAHYRLSNHFFQHFPLPIQPCTIPPVPLPPNTNITEFPILMDEEPTIVDYTQKRCFKCQEIGHIKAQCKGKKATRRCKTCNSPTHRTSKCILCRIKPTDSWGLVPEDSWSNNNPEVPIVEGPAIIQELQQEEEMSLLERIQLLSYQEHIPNFCGKCGTPSPRHTEINCTKFEQCTHCLEHGSFGFIKTHICTPADDIISMGNDNDVDWSLYGDGEQ